MRRPNVFCLLSDFPLEQMPADNCQGLVAAVYKASMSSWSRVSHHYRSRSSRAVAIPKCLFLPGSDVLTTARQRNVLLFAT